jgi:hypothetical protein
MSSNLRRNVGQNHLLFEKGFQEDIGQKHLLFEKGFQEDKKYDRIFKGDKKGGYSKIKRRITGSTRPTANRVWEPAAQIRGYNNHRVVQYNELR